ncbi:hypothetical protein ACFSSC_08225 [Corynebacterium mendelii]|uniref:Uncharacterized protein n=1 Tax=Corynebacterium mendelii TaxID=2765362 RepID=A0A939E0H3_9CORY|nr:hypothetical protein [Corynebacterium mendelii]MBN9644680.1 hypothetical protein [Corynebacterium mendelii]
MTYHSRAHQGPHRIDRFPAVVLWLLFVLSAAGAVWFFRRAAVPDAPREILDGAWALTVCAVVAGFAAIGCTFIDGMRPLLNLAPGLTLILAGLVAWTFTLWAVGAVVLGAVWLAASLVREGDTPYYLRH